MQSDDVDKMQRNITPRPVRILRVMLAKHELWLSS